MQQRSPKKCVSIERHYNIGLKMMQNWRCRGQISWERLRWSPCSPRDCLLVSVEFVVLCRVGCLWVTGIILGRVIIKKCIQSWRKKNEEKNNKTETTVTTDVCKYCRNIDFLIFIAYVSNFSLFCKKKWMRHVVKPSFTVPNQKSKIKTIVINAYRYCAIRLLS